MRERSRTMVPPAGWTCAGPPGRSRRRSQRIAIAGDLDAVHRLPRQKRTGPPSPQNDPVRSDIQHLGRPGAGDGVGAPLSPTAPDSGERRGPGPPEVVEPADVLPPLPALDRGGHLPGTVQSRHPAVDRRPAPALLGPGRRTSHGSRPCPDRARSLDTGAEPAARCRCATGAGHTGRPAAAGGTPARHSVSVSCSLPPVSGMGRAGRRARKPTNGYDDGPGHYGISRPLASKSRGSTRWTPSRRGTATRSGGWPSGHPTSVLDADGPKHPEAVRERIEVALSEHPPALEARHLEHPEAGLGDAHVDQRLHLEAVTPEHHRRIAVGRAPRPRGRCLEAVATEGVVPVAEVGITGPVQQVDDLAEPEVPGLAESADVAAPGARHEPGSLGEVGALLQGGDEPGDLLRIGGPVRVHHDEEVAGGGSEPAGEGVSLSLPRLLDHDDARTEGACHGNGVIRRVPVDQDDLVEARRECAEDVRGGCAPRSSPGSPRSRSARAGGSAPAVCVKSLTKAGVLDPVPLPCAPERLRAHHFHVRHLPASCPAAETRLSQRHHPPATDAPRIDR